MNFVANICIFFVFLVNVRSSKIPVGDLDEEWTDFKKTYLKRYDYPEQEEMRKKIFAENLETIKKHNEKYAKGLSSYTMGINQFADMTREEFKKQMSCFSISNIILPSIPQTNFDYDVEDLPEEVDWTKKGVVTPVKYQGFCGSCYAFSAVAAMETQQALNSGHLVELSEQQIVDCDQSDTGCGGGYPPLSLIYVIENGGIENETAYPYKGKKGACQVKAENIKYKFQNFTLILPSGDEKALQKAVATVGVISVCIDDSVFQFYNGQVLDHPECGKDIVDLNHCVAVVGYGTLNGTQYWKVKNSWGTHFGTNGYVLMARNKDNQCGIATMASYPIV